MSTVAEAAVTSSKLTSSLGFTNVTAGVTCPTTDLQISANYGQINAPKPAEETRLMNKTGPVDQKELISYRNRRIDAVNTYNKIYYPARVTAGQEFGVRLDEILRTSDENGYIVCDEPIVLSISFKAPMSSNLSNGILNQIFQRAIGALDQNNDGTLDWMSLMMGATNPLVG